jgi:hypothetical protein
MVGLPQGGSQSGVCSVITYSTGAMAGSFSKGFTKQPLEAINHQSIN